MRHAVQRLLDDHEAMLMAVISFGELRYRLADYAAAEALFTEGLELCQRVWGEADFRTASTMNGLAFALLQRGKIAEAQPLMERSIELGEQRSPRTSLSSSIC
ncbi:MAG: tetratricopeptide repeat protein [Phycisphaerales bacterium]|nr:tetratricopeptide repeat protein [Phycisphaerales bacterium]